MCVSFLKTFSQRRKCFKEMELSSTKVDLFYITHFPLFSVNYHPFKQRKLISHSWNSSLFPEISILGWFSPVSLPCFQFWEIFFFLRSYIGNKWTKNCIIFFAEHFHSGGINFHLMNIEFYAGNTLYDIFCLYSTLVAQCKWRSRLYLFWLTI